MTAFQQLCSFEPFLEKEDGESQELPGSGVRGATKNMLGCAPFLQNHVRLLFALLVAGLLVEAWVSSLWPIEFLDVKLGVVR